MPSQRSARGAKSLVATLAERWTGTNWVIQPTPNPPSGGTQLTGVACSAPTACTAVGSTFTSSGGMILAEDWNGSRWAIQRTPLLPNTGDHFISSPAVACPARTTCTAVGGNEHDGAGLVTVAERWHGSNLSTAGPSASLGPGLACGPPLGGATLIHQTPGRPPSTTAAEPSHVRTTPRGSPRFHSAD